MWMRDMRLHLQDSSHPEPDAYCERLTGLICAPLDRVI